MAQGYQDITGQIIRSVIALVDELEQVLGKLVAHCRMAMTRAACLVRALPAQPDWQRGLGPQVAGHRKRGRRRRPGRHRRVAVADGGRQVIEPSWIS